MQALVQNSTLRVSIKSILLDLLAIGFIYMVPTLSHMLSFPLYYLEPMRIMVILAMMHTHRNNAYILALTLPAFSFALAAHPVFIKSMLISIELMAMVAVFYLIRKHMHSFVAILLSIWISKAFYYLLKYIAIYTLLPNEPLVGISLWIQLLTSLGLSIYVFLVLQKNSASEKKKPA